MNGTACSSYRLATCCYCASSGWMFGRCEILFQLQSEQEMITFHLTTALRFLGLLGKSVHGYEWNWI